MAQDRPLKDNDAPLTARELAKWLRVSPKRPYALVKEGCPHLRIGSDLRFFRREVVDWLRQRAQMD